MTTQFDVKTVPLKLYNTAKRHKEVLTPLKNNTVALYTCGPTVYNYAHIGNFRTYIFEDLLRRTIQFFGMNVYQVMNLTDVDDKTIKGALAKGVSLNEFTQTYKDAFFEDLRALNIQPAEAYPAATDFIDAMIQMIEVLIEKGFAYRGGDGSIYYAISKFPTYGCLSHLHLEDLQSGASHRVDNDEYEKDHVADFVLWKAYDEQRDGNIFWESPFGKGRPGWHLECSAMAIQLLGQTIDIHVGGIDNMFPHHENEIAQSEAYSGKPFAKIWMHAEHLVVDGRKMSKSLGNFYVLRDLLNQGYSGPQIRYLLLQTHYKTSLNFSLAGLDAAKESLNRLNGLIQRLLEIESTEKGNKVDLLIKQALISFAEPLADDLNISVALAALFDFVREINGLCDANLLSKEEAEQVLELLKRFDMVLGVLSFEKAVETIPQELHEALEKRLQARKDKNWALADQLRDLIISRGYVIEDTAHGVRLKKGG
ncbi:MAG: cysteine--tRNA ligase [Parachlamydiaceae bacterium]|nr:cysteine--tRNA ligase [Parachlamydiaceae bacterium]